MIMQLFNVGSAWLPPVLSVALTSLVAILLVVAFVRFIAVIIDVVLKIKDIVLFWK